MDTDVLYMMAYYLGLGCIVVIVVIAFLCAVSKNFRDDFFGDLKGARRK